MKFRNPSKEELNNWKQLGRRNLFAMLFVEELWENGFLTTRQRDLIKAKIDRKWKEENI